MELGVTITLLAISCASLCGAMIVVDGTDLGWKLNAAFWGSVFILALVGCAVGCVSGRFRAHSRVARIMLGAGSILGAFAAYGGLAYVRQHAMDSVDAPGTSALGFRAVAVPLGHASALITLISVALGAVAIASAYVINKRPARLGQWDDTRI